jgi:hypothetical protein
MAFSWINIEIGQKKPPSLAVFQKVGLGSSTRVLTASPPPMGWNS